MGNLLLCLMEFGGNLIEKSTHSFLSIEHISSFLIAFDVIFNFLLKIFVDSLILENAQKALINFWIEEFILISKLQMLFSEVFSFESWLIKLTFASSHRVIETLKFWGEIFVFWACSIKCLTKLLILRFTLITVSLKFLDLFLKLTFFLTELLDFLVSGWDDLFSSFEFIKKLFMILLSLNQNILKLAVSGL